MNRPAAFAHVLEPLDAARGCIAQVTDLSLDPRNEIQFNNAVAMLDNAAGYFETTPQVAAALSGAKRAVRDLEASFGGHLHYPALKLARQTTLGAFSALETAFIAAGPNDVARALGLY